MGKKIINQGKTDLEGSLKKIGFKYYIEVELGTVQ